MNLKQIREKLTRRSDSERARLLAKHRQNKAATGQHIKLVKSGDKK